MATNDPGLHGHPQSTAKIGGHPIHPMLIPFPVAFFAGTLVTDIVHSQSDNPFWPAKPIPPFTL